MSKPKHSRLCPTFGINPRVGFKCKACTVPPKGTSKPKTKPASPWQPIETAPKDSEYVPVAWRQDGHVVIDTGSPSNGFWLDTYGNRFTVAPNYWMPIPPLPEGER